MGEKTLGQLIYETRLVCGYSQFQLGKLIGVTDKAVSKWENGDARPRFEHCIRLAAILGISFDELISSNKNDAREEDEMDKQQHFRDNPLA